MKSKIDTFIDKRLGLFIAIECLIAAMIVFLYLAVWISGLETHRSLPEFAHDFYWSGKVGPITSIRGHIGLLILCVVISFFDN